MAEFFYKNIKAQTPAIQLLRPTTNNIFWFLTKKILILAQNWNLRKNYPSNLEIWWPVVNKTHITLKNFRNKPMTKMLSLEAMLQATKSGWVASISKLSKIASWKPSVEEKKLKRLTQAWHGHRTFQPLPCSLISFTCKIVFYCYHILWSLILFWLWAVRLIRSLFTISHPQFVS